MKIKFGAIVVAGSGKIGGHVAAKNRAGAYLRTKVTPSNPNTPAQANARAILASLSTGWGLLTESQRQSWNDAVASFATTDIFGDIKNPSGINLYVKLNANLAQSGQALLDVAPEKLEIPFFPLESATFSIAGATLTFNTEIDEYSGTKVRIQATPAFSSGISNFKSKLRNIGYTADVDDDASNYSLYVTKFGAPVVGSKIAVSIAPIMASGQQGTAQSVIATVVA